MKCTVNTFGLLAIGERQLPSGLDYGTRQTLSGTAPIIIAAGTIAALVVIWAIYLRKPARRRERGLLVESPSSSKAGGSDSETGERSGRRRKRRRRDGHRTRNPTVAETGGLPPVGSGDSNHPQV
jgi:hypothetical protein